MLSETVTTVDAVTVEPTGKTTGEQPGKNRRQKIKRDSTLAGWQFSGDL
jgi:hypothetical protein